MSAMKNSSTDLRKKYGYNGGYFRNTKVLENMLSYMSKNDNSLDGMLTIKVSKTKEGKDNITLKYIPDPEGDKKMYDFKIDSKAVVCYGKPYNEKMDYPPQLKQAKFVPGVLQTKFDKNEVGHYTNLREGEAILDSDINVDYKLRELVDQYLKAKVAEFKANKSWGKSKSASVHVTNFEVKTGLVDTIINDDGEKEDRLVPYITYQFSEDKQDKAISSSDPSRPDYKLRFFDPKGKVLDISRRNINEIIPSGTEVRIAVSYARINIVTAGISICRYVNCGKVMSFLQKSSVYNMDDDSEEEEKEEKEEQIDFDED